MNNQQKLLEKWAIERYLMAKKNLDKNCLFTFAKINEKAQCHKDLYSFSNYSLDSLLPSYLPFDQIN